MKIYILLGLELLFFMGYIVFQFKKRKYKKLKYRNIIIFLLFILITGFLTLALKSWDSNGEKEENIVTLTSIDKESNTVKDIDSIKNIEETESEADISNLNDDNKDISVEDIEQEVTVEYKDKTEPIKTQECNNSLEENNTTGESVSPKVNSQETDLSNVNKVEKDWYKSNSTFICNETGNTFNIGWLDDEYLDFIFNSSMVLCSTTDVDGQVLDDKIIYSCTEDGKSAVIEYYFTENKVNVIDNFGDEINYSGVYYLQ